MQSTEKIPSSYLFVPGDRADRFDKACSSIAEAVIIDLEDAVSPQRKSEARTLIKTWLENGGRAIIRINAHGTEWFEEDCALLQSEGVAGVMLPKAETRVAVEAVLRSMREPLPLILLIETARGLLNAADLARVEGVSRLAFGSVDFQLDCNIPDDDEGLAHARAQLVLASAAGRLAPPIDGVTTILNDPEVLRRETERARRLGFGGKLCIHPNQLEIVNAGFAPTEEDLLRAREIMDVVEASDDFGVAMHNGKLIERPVIEWAKRVMARA